VTQAQGETAVTTSALILAGLYGYRRTTETITKAPLPGRGQHVGAPLKAGLKPLVESPLGVGELAPLGQWATGMGLTFIALSIAASVNPTFGGSFAILVAVGGVLGNGRAVLKDLGHGLAGGEIPTGEEKPQAPDSLEALHSNHPPVK
jgi:hypothetical protein